jgi:MoaA/NifB/PqqE/SkfB family radical SAM enzyme
MNWTAICLGNTPCPGNCKYCSVHAGIGSIVPKVEDVDRLFSDQLKYYYGLIHVFAGTEPTLNVEAIARLEAIQRDRSELRFSISINGSNPDLVARLAKSGWIVSVSYDGVEQDENRGTDSKIVQDTIMRLNQIGNAFLVTATVHNWSSIYGTLQDIAMVLGVNFIEVSQVLPIGRGRDLSQTSDDPQLLINAVEDLKTKAHVFTPLSGLDHCLIVARGDRYWYLDEQGKWQHSSCLADTTLASTPELRE